MRSQWTRWWMFESLAVSCVSIIAGADILSVSATNRESPFKLLNTCRHNGIDMLLTNTITDIIV